MMSQPSFNKDLALGKSVKLCSLKYSKWTWDSCSAETIAYGTANVCVGFLNDRFLCFLYRILTLSAL